MDYSQFLSKRSALRKPSAIRTLQSYLSIPNMVSVLNLNLCFYLYFYFCFYFFLIIKQMRNFIIFDKFQFILTICN